MQNHFRPKSPNPQKDCLLRYWILLQESAMAILHLKIAGFQKPSGICSAAISHFVQPEFPYQKLGNPKLTGRWTYTFLSFWLILNSDWQIFYLFTTRGLKWSLEFPNIERKQSDNLVSVFLYTLALCICFHDLAYIWVNYKNYPTWIELTLVLPSHANHLGWGHVRSVCPSFGLDMPWLSFFHCDTKCVAVTWKL